MGQTVDNRYLEDTRRDLKLLISKLRSGGRGIGDPRGDRWATFGSRREAQIRQRKNVDQAKDFVEDLREIYARLAANKGRPLDHKDEQRFQDVYDEANSWVNELQSRRPGAPPKRHPLSPADSISRAA